MKITNIFNFATGLQGRRFWTSGMKFNDNSITWMASNKAATYTNWSQGEPSNIHSHENCINIEPNYKWNDLDCIDVIHFICEFQSSKTMTFQIEGQLTV